MDYIRFAIRSPVKVTVGVLLLLLFGFIALFTIPVQLVPNVDQPIITVQTNWTGRSPEEVERAIIEKQEDKLKGIANLKKMTATAAQGQAEVKLEFFVGANMIRALQEVSDALREVPSYPEQVDQPVIVASSSAQENAIAWMVLSSHDPDFNVASLYDLADKRIKPVLERVEGLSQINIYGGREQQVHLQLDPRRLAERNITFNQLRNALRLENINISAGDLAAGRLDVRVRTIGQYETLDSVRQTIVAYGEGGPVRVGDLGDVVLTLEKQRAFVHSRGRQALAINAIRETGSNVVAVMAGLRERIEVVNDQVLPEIARTVAGPEGPEKLGLRIDQVYDETLYIYDALALVQANLWQGGALCVLVLLVFLRRSRHPGLTMLAALVMLLSLLAAIVLPEGGAWRYFAFASLVISTLVVLGTSTPTTIIALAIPTCIVGTFVVLTAAGRNLNVVSLAGLAFAIGMVVDAAIVVLENTDRHMQLGKGPGRAAYDATREVWAAILAGALTTLVVFLPVLTIQEEAGQLFLDISLAICAAVALSLVVATTVIPSAATRWLRPNRPHESHRMTRTFESLFGVATAAGELVKALTRLVERVLRLPLVGGPLRVLTSLAGLVGMLLGVAVLVKAGQDLGGVLGALGQFKAVTAPVILEVIGLPVIAIALVLLGLLVWSTLRARGPRDRPLVAALAVILGAMLALGLLPLFRGGGAPAALAAHVGTVASALAAVWPIALAIAMVFTGIVLLPPRLAIVAFFTLGSLLGAFLLMPPPTYLPTGNRNLVFGIMLTPPSYSMEQNQRMAARMESRLQPFWDAQTRADLLEAPTVRHPFTGQEVQNVPPIEQFFYVSFGGRVFYGGTSREKQNVQPITALLPWAAQDNPGVIPLAFQASLFGRGIGGGNSVEVEVTGTDLDAVRNSAAGLYGAFVGKYTPFAVQTDPLNFDLPGPELRVEIDRVRAADLGIDVAALGLGVQALVDGAVIGDFRHQGDAIDLLMVRNPVIRLTPEYLEQVPVAIAAEHGGGTVPLGAIATFTPSTSPQSIKRIEQLRAVTLTVSAPENVPLEELMTELRGVVAGMRQAGTVAGVEVNYAGTADQLVQVRQAFLGEWHGWTLRSLYSLLTSRLFLALLVCYLVMAAVFESFVYPLVILFSVPLAAVGGFLGLRLAHEVNPSQMLDVVTMLGFVILIGVVVNNAILLVAQALNFMKGVGQTDADHLERALGPHEAIREAVRTRMRPVLMTTITTVCGMLPLVVKPGAGSELYRGLGSVVLGGLLCSAVFTLLVVPMVFSLVLDAKIAWYRRLGWPVPELSEGEALTPAPATAPAEPAEAVAPAAR